MLSDIPLVLPGSVNYPELDRLSISELVGENKNQKRKMESHCTALFCAIINTEEAALLHTRGPKMQADDWASEGKDLVNGPRREAPGLVQASPSLTSLRLRPHRQWDEETKVFPVMAPVNAPSVHGSAVQR